MVDTSKIVPIMVGTDVNGYQMARSFHEAYGVKTHCVGVAPLIMTRDSQICDVTIVDGLKEDATFVQAIKDLAAKYGVPGVKPILCMAGDEYVELGIRNREALKDVVWIPYPDLAVLDDVYYKDHFYALCEQNGLPYPTTVVVNQQDYKQKVADLTIAFPVAMKPADAAQQIALDFEGQRKAYKFQNKEDILDMIQRTYAAGYDGNILLQDFIPGGDDSMYTVNFYADRDHNVRQITMGRQLLQDPSDFLVGNYVATFIEHHEAIEQKLIHFVKAIQYSGFGNFDLKFDARDQEFKLIELNPRQGRSAFYTTASGTNLVIPAVEELLFDVPFTETDYNRADYLWLGVNADDAVANVEHEDVRAHMQELIAAGKASNTLQYAADKSIFRNHRVKKYYDSYTKRFAEKKAKREQDGIF
ncbi:hypothetical protein [Lacticaseibacillus kribbianus]|uniref:carboxylate--amine ligase n=1 Tax=Lacticaseibacillus kribbianus TaxID=2926292 RepID=UPI001CD4CF4E|nr:hypothetical protein [Lacticaseibacillus kribbianus]